MSAQTATRQPTRDALATQSDDYAELSRLHAARGDGRRAALSAWAADLRAVQAVLWEAADPWGQLVSVAGAVETALLSRGAPGEVSVRQVLETAREALLAAFDEPEHAQLQQHWSSLGHLDGVPAPKPGAANQAVLERLDGRGGEQPWGTC